MVEGDLKNSHFIERTRYRTRNEWTEHGLNSQLPVQFSRLSPCNALFQRNERVPVATLIAQLCVKWPQWLQKLGKLFPLFEYFEEYVNTLQNLQLWWLLWDWCVLKVWKIEKKTVGKIGLNYHVFALAKTYLVCMAIKDLLYNFAALTQVTA